ncbi:hypothetical protein [Alteraurantiacibacter buctensis]|uniref:Uncharacterized protein n=1 Tax=Alteraurantiacibacter buctensis TaxID=1503981 RepID=A0A844Z2I7_9SPHN|nr:hypothetical protein [Alteraurantiacibacter buctensis]MXO73360.1 hypothetical protein [Alteraurantiacibacter buctensis]
MIVILNLFQDPSCRRSGAIGRGAAAKFGFGDKQLCRAENWILKRVQDDGKEEGGAFWP